MKLNKQITSIALFIFFLCQLSAQKGIQFSKDFSNAFLQADKEDKKVFIYFYTDNCQACEYLEDEFSNTSIGNLYNDSFINFKSNGRTSGKRTAEYFGIYSFPTLLFIDSNGEPDFSARGYRDGKGLFEVGKMARRPARDIKKLMERKYKDTPTDTDHLYDYIEYQMIRGNFSKANKLSKEYLELRHTIEESIWMNFVLDYANDQQTYSHDLLIQEKDKFYETFGRDVIDPIIWGSIIGANQNRGQFMGMHDFERAFTKEAVRKGYDADDEKLRRYYFNYLFSNSLITSQRLSNKERDLHTRYAFYAIENKEQKYDREIILRAAIYLVKYHQKDSTMSTLNDILASHFEATPHHSFLDMQSVALYALGEEDLAVEKILAARELAVSAGVRDYTPSVTLFKKQRILK